MSVVKSNIEKVRGRVRVESKAGEGTTFTLKIPLTLGIIEGVIVRVGSEELIVPLSSVVEMLQARECRFYELEDAKKRLRYRNQEAPVFSLGALVGLIDSKDENLNDVFVMSRRGDEYLALRVNEVLGICSAIIRPLDHINSSSKGLAGGAILSDGGVRLVVDLAALCDSGSGARKPGLEGCSLEGSQPNS